MFLCCRVIFLYAFIPSVHHGASWLLNNKRMENKELIILSGCI